MKILVPTYILSPQKLFKNMAVAFNEAIQKIAPLKELQSLFPDAEVIYPGENSLLMPGLINAHVHLEFSANKTQLTYGDFIPWLYSVIDNREELIQGCNTECMLNTCNKMLAEGITTFGAISSHGMDLEACANAPQNVVFFNELIGSQAAMADALFGDFLTRLEESKQIKRKGFDVGVAIHSPYSVHPILIKKALQIAKEEHLRVTAHFMESEAEREWLDESKGAFEPFFKNFLQQKSAVSDAKEFLEHFQEIPTLLTHGSYISEDELHSIKAAGHTIIHCPISNRLLGNKTLNIKRLNDKHIEWIIATDGLSSNYGLNLFEEMKISLFMHADAPLQKFAKALVLAGTSQAAKALRLNTGEIQERKNADMLVLDLDFEPAEESIYTHLLLHKYTISKVFLNGQLKKGTL